MTDLETTLTKTPTTTPPTTPITTSTETSMNTTTVVALADILEHPDNPRRDVGDVTELAASIREQGILQPLVVAPNTGRKKARWVCLAGHRRMKAARKAGLVEVPVVVRRDLATRADQISAMVAENMHRADLTPIEEASAYQMLLDDVGLTVKQISTATGRPTGTVRSRLKLVTLAEVVQEKVANHQITLADAEALADLAVKDPAAAERASQANNDLRWAIQAEVNKIARREQFDRLFALVDAQSDVPVILAANLPKNWTSYGTGPGPKRARDETHFYPPLRAGNGLTGGDWPGPFCPHRAVVVTETDYPKVEDQYCTDPASHRTPDHTPANAAADRAVYERSRREIEAFNESASVAAALRKQWLSDVVAGGGIAAEHTAAAVQLLARLNLTPVAETGQLSYWADACSWLRDLPGFPPDADDEEDDYTPVLDALARLTPATTALAVTAALVEDGTSSINLAPGHARPAAGEWVALLDLYAACGYRLSEWEVGQLDRARTQHLNVDASSSGDLDEDLNDVEDEDQAATDE